MTTSSTEHQDLNGVDLIGVDFDGNTLLMRKIWDKNKEFVEQVFSKDADGKRNHFVDLSVMNDVEFTALMMAIETKQYDIIKILLDNGATEVDRHVWPTTGYSPIIHAIDRDDIRLVRLLLAGDLSTHNGIGLDDPLTYPRRFTGDFQTELGSYDDRTGYTALMFARGKDTYEVGERAHNSEITQLIITHIKYKSQKMGCNSCVDTSLRKSIKLLRPDMVEWLLTLGIYNKTDINNELIIHSENIYDRYYTDGARREKIDKITRLLTDKMDYVTRIRRRSRGLGPLMPGGLGGSVKRKYKRLRRLKRLKRLKRIKRNTPEEHVIEDNQPHSQYIFVEITMVRILKR